MKFHVSPRLDGCGKIPLPKKSKCFNCSIVAHVQLFVLNGRIGPILPGCKVGDDDLGAVIEKGFCEEHWQSHQNRR